MLRQTDMSVLEVALACGFESSSYFSRSYRARFSTCPSQDRHEHPDQEPVGANSFAKGSAAAP
ncbi:Helix-turn-helix domain protein [compost metagenome]